MYKSFERKESPKKEAKAYDYIRKSWDDAWINIFSPKYFESVLKYNAKSYWTKEKEALIAATQRKAK